jgi:beta-glucosidase
MARQSNVAACAKHFVGDGGTTHNIDENNTVSNYKQLVNIHMTPPYFDAIVKGVSTIMVSYSSWNGMKMHANRFLISHVLKKQLRFKGFVISDWQGIDRITSPRVLIILSVRLT